jgi:hypothetical protein
MMKRSSMMVITWIVDREEVGPCVCGGSEVIGTASMEMGRLVDEDGELVCILFDGIEK